MKGGKSVMTEASTRREDGSGDARIPAQDTTMSRSSRDLRRSAQAGNHHRWECTCTPTPTLLGIVDDTGRVNIKIGDRYWHITGGSVEALCPKCGKQHVRPAEGEDVQG